MFELAFGKFSIARKPIISGGAIRPSGLLSYELVQIITRYDFLEAI